MAMFTTKHTSPMSTPPKTPSERRNLRFAIGLFVLVIAGVAAMMAFVPDDHPEANVKTTLNVGDSCYVNETYYGAVTDDAQNQLTEAVLAKDQAGIDALTTRRLVLPLLKGTRATLLKPGIMHRQVKLTTGKWAGQTVYLPTEYVTAL